MTGNHCIYCGKVLDYNNGDSFFKCKNCNEIERREIEKRTKILKELFGGIISQEEPAKSSVKSGVSDAND